MKCKAILLALPLMLATLTGCGKKQSSNNIKIKFWHTFGQSIVDGFKEKITDFTKAVKENDGVNVEVEMAYQGTYDDMGAKIAKGYSVNNKPTLAVAYPDNVSDYLAIGASANDEFVVNLDKYIKDDKVGFGKEAWLGDKYDETDFIEGFYSEGSQYLQKGTYSLPFMKSTEIMFYNMNFVNKAMKDFKPELYGKTAQIEEYMKTISWDEFCDLCSYIAAHKSDVGNTIEVPFVYDSDANFFVSKMYQEKIPFASITSDGKGDIDFGKEGNKEKVVSFLEGVNDLYHNNVITTKGIKGTYGSDFFTAEKCVFSIGSSGGSGYNFPQADAFTLGVTRVPASNKNALYVTQGPTLAIFNDSGLSKELNEKTTLYAWKFVKFITNGEVNTSICIDGSQGYVPVRYSAYETTKFMEFLEEGEDYATCAKVVMDINNNAGYLSTPTFKGSARLRDECGALLAAAATASNKSAIPGLIDTAISNARLAM